MITLLDPIWTLLLVPMAFALWIWGPPSRWLTVLRTFTLIFTVLSLAGLSVPLPSREGTIVVL
ncbi:MAG: hypothetical protein AAF488_14545, partial [Planctomycetota bacterium]